MRAEQQPRILMIPVVLAPSKSLEFAAFALVTARLGRKSPVPDQNLTQTSLQLYNQSLKAVQRALNDRQQMSTDDTLSACMLLALYEVFECPSGG